MMKVERVCQKLQVRGRRKDIGVEGARRVLAIFLRIHGRQGSKEAQERTY